KGALIYIMLHDLLGAQAFQHFLALLRTAGAPLTSADIRHAAEAVSGRELGWFFQQWVNERVWLDYAVGQVETTTQTSTEGQTVYQNRVEIRRLGAAIMPVTVRLVARDGSVYTTELDGSAPTTVVTCRSAHPLTDVEIDPAHQLPDVHRLNNFYLVPYPVPPL